MTSTKTLKAVAPKKFDNFVHNKYFLGIILVLVNVGSKHLGITITPAAEKFFKMKEVRCFIWFCVFYSATKDFFLSLFLVAFFYLTFSTLLNENSQACILPKKALTTEPTEQEYKNCKKKVEDYEIAQKNKK